MHLSMLMLALNLKHFWTYVKSHLVLLRKDTIRNLEWWMRTKQSFIADNQCCYFQLLSARILVINSRHSKPWATVYLIQCSASDTYAGDIRSHADRHIQSCTMASVDHVSWGLALQQSSFLNTDLRHLLSYSLPPTVSSMEESWVLFLSTWQL